MNYLIGLLAFLGLIAIGIFLYRSNTSTSSLEKSEILAERHYKKAVRLEKRGEYYKAIKFYEKSLALKEAEHVRNAYMKCMSAVGPL